VGGASHWGWLGRRGAVVALRSSQPSKSIETNAITPELLQQLDAYWRASNYLSVGQICLCGNPLVMDAIDRLP
jgi:phosphoketolase